ncbi:hypothetical protein [Amycolatopsis minnesotensis]|uniref:hypothetical protein n=1 Tax=Amycolatopsis minnesotensis TaxID=337894 RepID=UPI0031E2F453
MAPDGELSVWTSDNVQGYSPHHDIWVQWVLFQDVYGLICPPGRRHIRDVQAIHSSQGTVLSPRRRGDDRAIWSTNLPATAMVEALPVAAGDTTLYGMVAWLGALSAPEGLHGTLADSQLNELADLAEHHGAGG